MLFFVATLYQHKFNLQSTLISKKFLDLIYNKIYNKLELEMYNRL